VEKRRHVVLLQPPYLRFFGSHNDRLPLELCYLSAHLNAAGFETTVLNADWTGATKYIAWRNLFDASIYLRQAVDGLSPLYSECLEMVESFEPAVVVLAAADGLTPWVDLGNAYTTARISQELRAAGIYTVGVGPFYNILPRNFLPSFDAILLGVASPSIVDVVRLRPRNAIVTGQQASTITLPVLDASPRPNRDDVVMTAVGCPFACKFCLARDTKYRRLDLQTVADDIVRRRADCIDFGDSIMPLQPARVRALTKLLTAPEKTFSCEVSVSSVTEDSLAALYGLGVRGVKIGVESGDDLQLVRMGKRQTARDIVAACSLIKSFGMHVSAYVLLGGPDSSPNGTRATYELCQAIDADDYIINVWAFHDLATRDFRYDCHWSDALVREWHLGDMIGPFFDLQAPEKRGLGPLIRMSSDWSNFHRKLAGSET
jgi:Radical SAM superfamily